MSWLAIPFFLVMAKWYTHLICRCDVCVDGPPEMQNLKEEADALMQAIAAHHVSSIHDLPALLVRDIWF